VPERIYEPAPGIRVILAPDPDRRFKTAVLTLQLLVPLAQDTVSANAVLPYLMRRGSAAHPDYPALKRELDRLYGAQISGWTSRVGEAQALYLQAFCLEDRFALAGEPVAAQCAELLRGMVFDPPFERGLFRAADLEEEKRCLADSIRSLINNKQRYARQQCVKLLCRGEPYAVPSLGEEEGALALTPEAVTAAWRRVLSTARVQILYQGSGDGEAAVAPFLKGFEAIRRAPVTLTVERHPHRGPFRREQERLAVAQAKLVIGLRCRGDEREQDHPASRVAFALLGGTPTSILFRTVREKLSLCYYCSAGCERNKGVAFIDSGVAPDKAGAAREEILRQLRLLQAGEFTEEDLEDTRRYLASLYTGMGDSQGALGSYYLSQATLPRIITPEEGLRELAAVTRDRVIAAAGLWEPACEYLLMPNGEEAEEDE